MVAAHTEIDSSQDIASLFSQRHVLTETFHTYICKARFEQWVLLGGLYHSDQQA